MASGKQGYNNKKETTHQAKKNSNKTLTYTV
jgi:hypothetical protein